MTAWAAFQAGLAAEGSVDLPLNVQRRQDPLRRAAYALGPDRTRAAQERGAAMSLQTAAELVRMLADAHPGAPRLSRRQRD